ncbi:DUF2076 domain-containing protein [Noviherbaspirillum massiliense]|uniref:DUF2076 domain-containing protein n=1 Tax=Noviherbaspirillum massiliense TaxID=1465823 RepID=UPI000475009E|nr:DUF2076 family protein [Noviherbaspirillum massiliense]
MNAQESQLLQDFLSQLVQVRGVNKDPQADAMIARAMAQQPDAPYLLVQRGILLEQALDAAKAQIAQLQSQQETGRASGTSFLDPSSAAWGRSANSNVQNAPAADEPVMERSYRQPPPMPAARPGLFNAGGGSFLGTMAATAAGVAGGAFLFHGIESLLGHHGTDAARNESLASLPAQDVGSNDYAFDSSRTEGNFDDLNDIGLDDGASDDPNEI